MSIDVKVKNVEVTNVFEDDEGNDLTNAIVLFEVHADVVDRIEIDVHVHGCQGLDQAVQQARKSLHLWADGLAVRTRN